MKGTARIRANRHNAKRSTGPRSDAGKKRVASNALRYGLALPVTSIPEADATAVLLAHLLAGDNADPQHLDLARQVAEAQVDLIRVRKARAMLLQRPLEPPRRTAKEEIAIVRLASILRDHDRDSILGQKLQQMHYPVAPADPDEHLVAIIADRISELRRLDRYERRALSWRKFAVRALDSQGSRSSSLRQVSTK